MPIPLSPKGDTSLVAFSWNGTETVQGVILQPTAARGAGELISNVYDLVKWDIALNSSSLLTASSKKAMWTAGTLTDGSKTSYGFGWGVEEVSGHRTVFHGGGTGAFTTLITRLVDDKVTVIVLTNRAGANPDKIARAIVGILVPTLKPPVLKPVIGSDAPTALRIQKILQSLAEGKIDASEFTPNFYKIMLEKSKPITDGLSQLGQVQSFLTIEEKEQAGVKLLRYQANYSVINLKISVQIEADGKISGMLIQPE